MVASHSNAHAVCPHARNLSDAQLRAVGETGGIVGLNLAAAFLRPDGQMSEDGAFDWVVPHLDRMLDEAGEAHVGIGTDFDGATVPREIGGAAGLPVLVEAMREAGYGEDLVGTDLPPQLARPHRPRLRLDPPFPLHHGAVRGLKPFQSG